MLSRTAENLYWAARYIERADSISRLLEVGYRMSLIPNTNSGYNNEWESILDTSDIKSDYLKYYKELNKENIEFFLLFDDRNNSSVSNCIKNARENIRMVRTAVTLRPRRRQDRRQRRPGSRWRRHLQRLRNPAGLRPE